MSEKTRMRAARLKYIRALTEEQRNEVIQLLKTDSLVPLEPDGYYLVRGDRLIAMLNTMANMRLELEAHEG